MRKKKEISFSDIIGNPADKSVPPVVTRYKKEIRVLKKRIREYEELVRLLKAREIYVKGSDGFSIMSTKIENLEYLIEHDKTTLRKG